MGLRSVHYSWTIRILDVSPRRVRHPERNLLSNSPSCTCPASERTLTPPRDVRRVCCCAIAVPCWPPRFSLPTRCAPLRSSSQLEMIAGARMTFEPGRDLGPHTLYVPGDEPTAGLPPAVAEKVFRVREIADSRHRASPETTERQAANTNRGDAQRRLDRLLAHPHAGGFGLIRNRYARDHATARAG